MPCAVLSVQYHRSVVGFRLTTSMSGQELVTIHSQIVDSFEERVIRADYRHVEIERRGGRDKWFVLECAIKTLGESMTAVLEKIISGQLQEMLKFCKFGFPTDVPMADNKLRLSGSTSTPDGRLSVYDMQCVLYIQRLQQESHHKEEMCIETANLIKKKTDCLALANLLRLSKTYHIESGAWMFFAVNDKPGVMGGPRLQPKEEGRPGSTEPPLPPPTSDRFVARKEGGTNFDRLPIDAVTQTMIYRQMKEAYTTVVRSYLTGYFSSVSYVRQIVFRAYANGLAMFRIYNQKTLYLEEVAKNSDVDSVTFLKEDIQVENVLRAVKGLIDARQFSINYKCHLYSVLNMNRNTVVGSRLTFYRCKDITRQLKEEKWRQRSGAGGVARSFRGQDGFTSTSGFGQNRGISYHPPASTVGHRSQSIAFNGLQ